MATAIAEQEEPYIKPINGVVQPPVVPGPERNIPLDAKEVHGLKYMKKVVEKLWTTKHAQMFHEPVNAVKFNIPDYHLKIKRPMDLGTIKMRLENNYYMSVDECKQDFQTMFTNCYIYNPPHDYYHGLARTVNRKYDELISNMPKWEDPRTAVSNQGSYRPSNRRSSGLKRKAPAAPGKSSGNRPTHLTGALKVCDAILKEMFSRKNKFFAQHFYVAVKESEVPGYHSFIKHPMDLGKMQRKLHSGEYSSPDEFADDMNLIISNCINYNSRHENSPFPGYAASLKSLFDDMWASIDRIEEPPTKRVDNTRSGRVVDQSGGVARPSTSGSIRRSSTARRARSPSKQAVKEDSRPWGYDDFHELRRKIGKFASDNRISDQMKAGLFQVAVLASPRVQSILRRQLREPPTTTLFRLNWQDCDDITLWDIDEYVNWCFKKVGTLMANTSEQRTQQVTQEGSYYIEDKKHVAADIIEDKPMQERLSDSSSSSSSSSGSSSSSDSSDSDSDSSSSNSSDPRAPSPPKSPNRSLSTLAKPKSDANVAFEVPPNHGPRTQHGPTSHPSKGLTNPPPPSKSGLLPSAVPTATRNDNVPLKKPLSSLESSSRTVARVETKPAAETLPQFTQQAKQKLDRGQILAQRALAGQSKHTKITDALIPKLVTSCRPPAPVQKETKTAKEPPQKIPGPGRDSSQRPVPIHPPPPPLRPTPIHRPIERILRSPPPPPHVPLDPPTSIVTAERELMRRRAQEERRRGHFEPYDLNEQTPLMMQFEENRL